MTVRRLLVAAACAFSLALTSCAGGQGAGSDRGAGSASAPTQAVGTVATGGPSAGEVRTVRSDATHLRFVKDAVVSPITPKSVQASGHGLLIANNMFYSHTVTLYDAATMSEKVSIKDTVRLGDLGIGGASGDYQGSPVEATWTKDGRYAYVTNYTMYGKGFDGRAQDFCGPWSGYKPSYVYRLDTRTMRFDKAVSVGAVPKFLLMSPDQRFVLVANWCSYTLHVVDTTTNTVVKAIPTGRNPRGLAITADGSTAYVACEGTGDIWVADLRRGTSRLWLSPGEGPRTLILSPDQRYLYATLANADRAVKIDVATAKVVAGTDVGLSPRSMDISADGTALYSVQFDEATVAKIRTSDMRLLEKRRTPPYPIGIAYEATTRTVWAAMYPGQMYVYDDGGTDVRQAEDIPLTPGPVVGTGSRDYRGKYATITATPGVRPTPGAQAPAATSVPAQVPAPGTQPGKPATVGPVTGQRS